MSADNPKTFEELLDYIEAHCATIYVRDFLNGQVGSYSLAQLPAARALHHAFRWVRGGVIPTRLILTQEHIEKLATDAPLDEAPPEETEP